MAFVGPKMRTEQSTVSQNRVTESVIGTDRLAATYHSYYDAERILVDDEPVRLARLALVAATAQVLRNGLSVLGVSAPEKM